MCSWLSDIHIRHPTATKVHTIPWSHKRTNTARCKAHTNTYIGALDGGEGAAAELGINVAPAEVVDNDDVVALIGKVEGGGPAAEAVATEDDDLLLLGGAVGADTVNVGSVLKCLHDEGGALGRGGLAGLRHGRPGDDESARRCREGRRKAGEDGGKEEDLHFGTVTWGSRDSART